MNAPIVKAYLLKEDLRRFWDYRSTAWAEGHLRQWLWRASHSRLAPFTMLAKSIRTRRDRILPCVVPLARISRGVLPTLIPCARGAAPPRTVAGHFPLSRPRLWLPRVRLPGVWLARLRLARFWLPRLRLARLLIHVGHLLPTCRRSPLPGHHGLRGSRAPGLRDPAALARRPGCLLRRADPSNQNPGIGKRPPGESLRGCC